IDPGAIDAADVVDADLEPRAQPRAVRTANIGHAPERQHAPYDSRDASRRDGRSGGGISVEDLVVTAHGALLPEATPRRGAVPRQPAVAGAAEYGGQRRFGHRVPRA